MTAPPRAGHGAVPLGDAVARFLDRYRDEKGTRVTYAETLAHLLAAVGGTALVTEAGPQAYAAVMSRWDDRAPATWNKHLADSSRCSGPHPTKSNWLHLASSNFFWPHPTGARTSCNLPGRVPFLAANGRSWWGRNILQDDLGGAGRAWNGGAGTTSRNHLAALRSFAAYAIRQEWITEDPARHLERRKVTQRGDKAIPLARLEALFTDDRHALRERALWRLLYDTAARAEEIPHPGHR